MIRPLLAMLGVILLSTAPISKVVTQDDDKVILVDLEVKSPRDAGKCYSEQFDRNRVELTLDFDDPLNTLDDFSLAEEPLEGPGCFMPEMKVIFSQYTYVFSLYCTSVIKYRNSAPFKPSNRTVQSDVQVTESVLTYLQDIRKKYFGERFDPSVAQRFVKKTEFDEVDTEVDTEQLFEDETDQEERELEEEATDKEGWFDVQKDPALETDETPEFEDEEVDDER